MELVEGVNGGWRRCILLGIGERAHREWLCLVLCVEQIEGNTSAQKQSPLVKAETLPMCSCIHVLLMLITTHNFGCPLLTIADTDLGYR